MILLAFLAVVHASWDFIDLAEDAEFPLDFPALLPTLVDLTADDLDESSTREDDLIDLGEMPAEEEPEPKKPRIRIADPIQEIRSRLERFSVESVASEMLYAATHELVLLEEGKPDEATFTQVAITYAYSLRVSQTTLDIFPLLPKLPDIQINAEARLDEIVFKLARSTHFLAPSVRRFLASSRAFPESVLGGLLIGEVILLMETFVDDYNLLSPPLTLEKLLRDRSIMLELTQLRRLLLARAAQAIGGPIYAPLTQPVPVDIDTMETIFSTEQSEQNEVEVLAVISPESAETLVIPSPEEVSSLLESLGDGEFELPEGAPETEQATLIIIGGTTGGPGTQTTPSPT